MEGRNSFQQSRKYSPLSGHFQCEIAEKLKVSRVSRSRPGWPGTA
jgi:hypothetical protein